ncbi:MAG: hypothetical protein HOU81_19780 [Hamadaea sp.]|uniref:hypothetical protein n=1 Tax=Hamadaea sp. TaxID=2024425 RepID=UPI0017C37EF1|nr:hypothetical protein [Hamadaea sp.]NUR73062.1 hypothetical protein [Hamadaea sp.]NUT20386.1 hypothetical protein [Hamadaea sp.]
MNKWLFRAVGTVGVASGIWLLGGAAAHAHEATAAPVTDPQALRGLLDNIFSPTNGLSDLGFSVDLPGNGVDAGLDANAPLQLRSNDGRTGVTAHLPQRQDVFFGGRLPSLANSVPAVAMLPERTEGLPGLSNLADGLTGGGGAGGILGGLTGSSGPLNVVSGLTRGGLTSGLTGGLTGGSAGGTEAPGGDLLGGLTGGDSGGVLSGLTGGDSGGILGGLTGGGLLGGLTGGDAAAQPGRQAPAVDPSQFDATQFDPSQFDPSQFDPSQFDAADLGEDPTVQTSTGTPADLDPAIADQLNQAGQDLVPMMIAQAAANLGQGNQAPSPFDLDWDLGDDSTVGDDALLGDDSSAFFSDNPNVDVKMVAPESIPVVDDLPLVGPILGDSGLGKIIVVGNLAQKLPVVGSVLNGQGLPSVDSVPVVNQLMSRGLLSDGRSAGLPVVGSVPMVGDLLGGGTDGVLGGLTGGDTGGILGGLTGGLGGDALGSLGAANPLGGVTGGLLGGTQAEPLSALPAPGMTTTRPALAAPTAVTRLAAPQAHAARHTETDRPVAGEDAEFPSRTEAGLPVVGSLPGLSLGRTLSQLPVVSDLPIVGSLPVASGVLRSLPLVGTVASLLPLD